MEKCPFCDNDDIKDLGITNGFEERWAINESNMFSMKTSGFQPHEYCFLKCGMFFKSLRDGDLTRYQRERVNYK